MVMTSALRTDFALMPGFSLLSRLYDCWRNSGGLKNMTDKLARKEYSEATREKAQFE
jgi:hypothetical protein